MNLRKPKKPCKTRSLITKMILLCTVLVMIVSSGCKTNYNSVTPTLQTKNTYFPNGCTIDGAKYEGEYYLLSGEAYRAMFER